MIRIRVTATDKVVPSHLANILSENINNITGGVDVAITVDMIKRLNMRRENDGDVCKLADACEVIDIDDNTQQVSLQRADITIDEQNNVKFFDE